MYVHTYVHMQKESTWLLTYMHTSYLCICMCTLTYKHITHACTLKKIAMH